VTIPLLHLQRCPAPTPLFVTLFPPFCVCSPESLYSTFPPQDCFNQHHQQQFTKNDNDINANGLWLLCEHLRPAAQTSRSTQGSGQPLQCASAWGWQCTAGPACCTPAHPVHMSNEYIFTARLHQRITPPVCAEGGACQLSRALQVWMQELLPSRPPFLSKHTSV
jgi:hypothetical protein